MRIKQHLIYIFKNRHLYSSDKDNSLDQKEIGLKDIIITLSEIGTGTTTTKNEEKKFLIIFYFSYLLIYKNKIIIKNLKRWYGA
jgi:hypothetical protein